MLENTKCEGPEKGKPIYFHIKLNENKDFETNIPQGHNSFIYLLNGELKVGSKKHLKKKLKELLEKGDFLKVKQ